MFSKMVENDFDKKLHLIQQFLLKIIIQQVEHFVVKQLQETLYNVEHQFMLFLII